MNYKKQVIVETPDEEEFLSPQLANILQQGQQYLFDDDQIAGQFDLQPRKSTVISKNSNTSSKKQNEELSNPTANNKSVSDDSPMNKQKLMCQIHKQEITLICNTSQWHCEPLCLECIPEHTQQHNKNKTLAQIRKFDEIKQECLDKCIYLQDQLLKTKDYLLELIEQPYVDDNLIHLKQWKQQVIQIFENYFDQMYVEYHDKINLVKMDENEQYQKLVNNVEQYNEQLQIYYTEITQLQINSIHNVVRINQEKDIQTIGDAIESIHKKLNEDYKLNSILMKYIQDNIGRLILIEYQNNNVKNKKHLQNSPKSDYSSVKTKSTKCSNCGAQLTYVSDFKKHMECPACAKVKRPNFKK